MLWLLILAIVEGILLIVCIIIIIFAVLICVCCIRFHRRRIMQGNRVYVDPAREPLLGQEPDHEAADAAPVVDPAAAVPDPPVNVHPVGVPAAEQPAIDPDNGVPPPPVVADGVPPIAGVDPWPPDAIPPQPPAAPDAAGENPPGHQPHQVVEPENVDVPQGQNDYPIDIRPQ